MRTYWISAIILLTAIPVKAASCSVDVFVIMGSPLPDKLYPNPLPQVESMFREIGVDVRLRTGRPGQNHRDRCGDPILIKLDESDGYKGTSDALAYSTPYQQSSVCVHIFLDRITGRGREPAFARNLLSHVMVHEIAHVLEKSGRHSSEGVMKARWSHQDYQNMRWRRLPFAAEDIRNLHESVSQRYAQARSAAVPTTES
jgi:hypothetical protein